jgi:hypothetical protein
VIARGLALQTTPDNVLSIKGNAGLSPFEPLGGRAQLLGDTVILGLAFLKQAQAFLDHFIITVVFSALKLLLNELVEW